MYDPPPLMVISPIENPTTATSCAPAPDPVSTTLGTIVVYPVPPLVTVTPVITPPEITGVATACIPWKKQVPLPVVVKLISVPAFAFA